MALAIRAAKVVVLLLLHNSAAPPPWQEVTVSRDKVAELLKNEHRVPCPAAAKLGFNSLVLIPAGENEGKELFHEDPEMVHNPHANMYATYLATSAKTGYAPGTAIGNAYALRTDGRNFTFDDFSALYDIGIIRLLELWSQGPPKKEDFARLANEIALSREAIQGAKIVQPDVPKVDLPTCANSQECSDDDGRDYEEPYEDTDDDDDGVEGVER